MLKSEMVLFSEDVMQLYFSLPKPHIKRINLYKKKKMLLKVLEAKDLRANAASLMGRKIYKLVSDFQQEQCLFYKYIGRTILYGNATVLL